MDPVRMSTALEESVNHLDQIAATMELVLNHIFEHDVVDLNGTEAEVMAAMEVCRQYPTWRAVLAHTWEALTNERDALSELRFVEGRRTA